MEIVDSAAFTVTEAALSALSLHFGDDRPPCLRVFLSFMSESGPRLELSLDAPTGDDATFAVDGWQFAVNRQLWLQAAPLTVDCDGQGFRIRSSLDFSEAGGSCGGSCSHH
ncbi:conserved hypothetical protein [Solidesulfovibrio fructosivorans JJ]]|uniref:HesB/YadR/YfhF-family protein n=1 Tax=Solidesulfovibrio fructosivorans JJ] TaxID=596151 RepID=E1K018_SOLFR|nr:hypothetical protein [Solidesulfovibrio fructosivorans]EFL50024.1 conserved hypothetical protein [Solidesulfovibrio fructosivorans JJ]]